MDDRGARWLRDPGGITNTLRARRRQPCGNYGSPDGVARPGEPGTIAGRRTTDRQMGSLMVSRSPRCQISGLRAHLLPRRSFASARRRVGCAVSHRGRRCPIAMRILASRLFIIRSRHVTSVPGPFPFAVVRCGRIGTRHFDAIASNQGRRLAAVCARLTYPRNLEESITIFGERPSVRIGGTAFNRLGIRLLR